MPTLEQLEAYYRAQYRAGDNNVDASPYEDSADLNFRTRSQVDYIRQLNLEPNSVVDVGCGFGLLLKCLRPLFPNARFSGIEVSEKCHPALKELGVNLARSPLERETGNPFPEQFDLLVASHVLEHSCDVTRFLSVCHDMLRPGGTAFFEVPNCEQEYGFDVPHVVFFTPKTLRSVLQQSGFTVVKCQTCGPSIRRWLPDRAQRLRYFVDDRFPMALGRLLEAAWRVSRSEKRRREKTNHAVRLGFEALRSEAKDQAWFEYDLPDFQHCAIRCVAMRHAEIGS